MEVQISDQDLKWQLYYCGGSFNKIKWRIVRIGSLCWLMYVIIAFKTSRNSLKMSRTLMVLTWLSLEFQISLDLRFVSAWRMWEDSITSVRLVKMILRNMSLRPLISDIFLQLMTSNFPLALTIFNIFQYSELLILTWCPLTITTSNKIWPILLYLNWGPLFLLRFRSSTPRYSPLEDSSCWSSNERRRNPPSMEKSNWAIVIPMAKNTSKIIK